jgi:16S rRNA (guanine1516-N2)-methyltransferase
MSYSIAYEDEALFEKACELAKFLNLPIDNHSKKQLLVTSQGLFLKDPPFSPMSVNFNSEIWEKRKSEGSKQGLVRACKPRKDLYIIDATAGWGRDAAILASFGAKVLMLERNPIMGVLLEDALQRKTSNLNLHLKKQDAIAFLSSLSEADFPDLIYLDPMHPLRQKSALVKKELQVLQQLVRPDKDVLKLIQVARTKILQRVVVKWPQKLPSLLPPNSSVSGKTVRFDVYLPNH